MQGKSSETFHRLAEQLIREARGAGLIKRVASGVRAAEHRFVTCAADGNPSRPHSGTDCRRPHRLQTCAPLRGLWRMGRVARPAGLEPTTCGLEDRCSIQLSYGRSVIAASMRVSASTAKRFGAHARGRSTPKCASTLRSSPDIFSSTLSTQPEAIAPALKTRPPSGRSQ